LGTVLQWREIEPKSEQAMSDYHNKTALISGGAEGIGFSIAMAMGQQGMNIVIGDIDEQQLKKAEQQLSDAGVPVLAMQMDVTDRQQWQNLADAAIERFGKVHMLVNNAGVASAPGSLEATNYEDWRWVLEVNLIGVLQGAEVIVPLIKQHGEGGWVINVASMAGMAGVPYAGAYTATKVAVVGLSESWKVELARHNIHVTVLCPAFVKTRIHLAGRNRQAEYIGKSELPQASRLTDSNPAKELVENGIPSELVGLRVVEALAANEFYIFTHPSHREEMQNRAKAIDEAFERAAQSPLLQGIKDDPVVSFGG
jgi:NAD(P)-dependent dehydrogenase (short-subunit alcohol dehydrogenase family)